MMITREQAREKVSAAACGRFAWLPADDEIVIVDAETIERDWGWVFFYTSRKWLETQDICYALAGNAPIIVERKTGALITTGTAKPIDDYIKRYEQCSNPHAEPLPLVRLTGWRPDALAISATKLIRISSRLGLAQSKKMVDDCLAGYETEIAVHDVPSAYALVASLTEVGFMAEVKYHS